MPFQQLASTIFIVILIYFATLTIWYSFLLLASFPEVIKRFKEAKYGNVINAITDDNLIPVTIVTPAYNEEEKIVNMIYSVMGSNYKNVKLIIVNDGSTDNMMAMLKKEFRLYKTPRRVHHHIKTAKILNYYHSRRFKNLMVIDKEHYPFNCAADAVNAGLNACKTPIMMTVDADTLLEPSAISRLLFTFFSLKNCISLSGAVYVLNGNTIREGKIIQPNLSSDFIPAVQSIEYLRSFLYGRTGWNMVGGALCFPGAFTMFETDWLRKLGGYQSDNFSYDAEITMRLHHWLRKNKVPHRLIHTPSAYAWTVVPSTLKGFWKQRNHWQRGMLRSAMEHIGMLFNPRYGVVGMVSFPCYILFEIFGPVVEFISYVLFIFGLFFGIVSWSAFVWFILLAWGYITFLSISMLFLDMISFNKYKRKLDAFKIVWLVFADMLWFRQYRAACCFFGTIQYFFNRLFGRPL